ncbi:MAG: hypothetical protein PHD15_05990 [Clostridia bacterium]|nr:hypothetical protein [Clostridia bacterium]MDD4387282.1 hypothetical protein [Clostridia bacterium]
MGKVNIVKSGIFYYALDKYMSILKNSSISLLDEIGRMFGGYIKSLDINYEQKS